MANNNKAKVTKASLEKDITNFRKKHYIDAFIIAVGVKDQGAHFFIEGRGGVLAMAEQIARSVSEGAGTLGAILLSQAAIEGAEGGEKVSKKKK